MQNLQRVGENCDHILSRLWTRVYEIFKRRRKPLYFPMPFSDCLCHVSFRRYSPLSIEVVEKPSKCKSLLAPNFHRASYASTVLAVIVCLSVRPSVCPSVTSRSCTKIAKRRITLTTPYDSSGTLVFRRQKSRRNSTSPQPGCQREVG